MKVTKINHGFAHTSLLTMILSILMEESGTTIRESHNF